MDINRIGVVILSVITIGVSFAVFPMIQNGVDDLSLYWQESCVINSERSTRAYVGVLSTALPAGATNVYVTDERYFIGSGQPLVYDSATNDCQINIDYSLSTPNATSSSIIYNERAQQLGSPATTKTAQDTVPAGKKWDPARHPKPVRGVGAAGVERHSDNGTRQLCRPKHRQHHDQQ